MLNLIRTRSAPSDPICTWSSLFVGQPPEWVWCEQCQRVARLREARFERGVWRCHYADCQGVLTDFWAWKAMCAAHPDWPRVPTMHVVYALSAKT